MNKHILVAMDHENLSKEELKKNLDAADAAAAAAYNAAAYDAAAAAYAATAAYAAYFDYAADIEYWVNEYFEITGENREEYEKALKEGRR